MTEVTNSAVISYSATSWADEDLAMIQVARGDPVGQARVEALTLAIALKTWSTILAQSQGQLVVRGDALGVLHDVIKMNATDSVLNCLAHEMAFIIAPLGTDLRAAHIWSERNVVCDRLSREGLKGVRGTPQLSGARAMKP